MQCGTHRGLRAAELHVDIILSVTSMSYGRCGCGNPIRMDSIDALCRPCRAEAESLAQQ